LGVQNYTTKRAALALPERTLPSGSGALVGDLFELFNGNWTSALPTAAPSPRISEGTVHSPIFPNITAVRRFRSSERLSACCYELDDETGQTKSPPIQEARHRGLQGIIGVDPSADKLSRMMTQLILPTAAHWRADFTANISHSPVVMTIEWMLCHDSWRRKEIVGTTCSNGIFEAPGGANWLGGS
jgi:hypothetical protein